MFRGATDLRVYWQKIPFGICMPNKPFCPFAQMDKVQAKREDTWEQSSFLSGLFLVWNVVEGCWLLLYPISSGKIPLVVGWRGRRRWGFFRKVDTSCNSP
jgi:hypothetical protein